MPARQDIKKILIIGAGPIVIGQACEFDYSGVQAVRALNEESIDVVVVNPNPATIMTDPDFVGKVYIEPLTWQNLARIIALEKPDALLPTMGGQTALNCSLQLHQHGILEKENVELIGASIAAINCAENRAEFREAMEEISLKVPMAFTVTSLDEAVDIAEKMIYPVIIRASYTLGGSGGGIANNREELLQKVDYAINLSKQGSVLLEQSLTGWKEFEMEVVRDKNDNCIIVCSIENINPMGVHTGDSITVSPAQTLTDKQYQHMRTASLEVLRRIGVETGGSNVQFAVHPQTGEMLVIEMNPRVSRSSALASKATGFPIAKVATKLAIGYTLDELRNGITGDVIPISFEPTLDYVVVKVPRFAFEKFSTESRTLTTSMQSIGETMAIGKCFGEAFMKALSALETKQSLLGLDMLSSTKTATADLDENTKLEAGLSTPTPELIYYVVQALRADYSIEKIYRLCHIDPWFLEQIQELDRLLGNLRDRNITDIDKAQMLLCKENGISDDTIAALTHCSAEAVVNRRQSLAVRPIWKNVDSCSAEFAATSSYMYSSYNTHCENKTSTKPKVLIIGAGPNRIGQGIEFDYCCVQAVFALQSQGYEVSLLNSNPETVSTDYDTTNKLYFDPVNLETIYEVYQTEKPEGIIVQYGGQTPLSLCARLEKMGVPILGTQPDIIAKFEDRALFQQMMQRLNIRQPHNEIISNPEQAIARAEALPYPFVARPSFVLGGQAMEIIYNPSQFLSYVSRIWQQLHYDQSQAILLDEFLENGIEVDVDIVSDGQRIFIGSIMEHIERAGIHSGDSACCIPAYTLSLEIQEKIISIIEEIVSDCQIIGLCNFQFVVLNEQIYVIEVNPRASRTVPFVSKTINIPLAQVGALCMLGKTLDEQGIPKRMQVPSLYCVKESVLPFDRFRQSDALLGPEMRSTGEVMGIGKIFGEAYGKAQIGAGVHLPRSGNVLISIRDADKKNIHLIAKTLAELGYKIYGTAGTAQAIESCGIACQVIKKVLQGQPHVVDMILNKKIDMVINTTEGESSIRDSYAIRRIALEMHVPLLTTLAAAQATCLALKELTANEPIRLDTLHKTIHPWQSKK